MKIVKANIEDIETLIQLRIDFLKSEMDVTPENELLIRKQLIEYFKKHLLLKDLIVLMAIKENMIASVAFLIVQERPASPSFISGLSGTLLNVFTYPQFRKQGYATKIINSIIEESKNIGLSSIDLSSTISALSIYRKLGFKDSNYMSMRLVF